MANNYFVRDTAGLAIGCQAGLKDNYGVKQRETLMLSSHMAWDLGLNYMLLAPLLCGMKTVINEEFYKDNQAYWNLLNKYSVNYLIGHANKINTLASTSQGIFPGEKVNLDSLKDVTFYNGTLEDVDIEMLSSHITGAEFHNACYLSFLGTFALGGSNSKVSNTGMLSQPLNNIEIYTEEETDKSNIVNPLYVKSPFYPATYTDYFSRTDTEDVGQFITDDGDFRLPYLGRFDDAGNVLISYPRKVQNTEGKTILTDQISTLLSKIKKVRYGHVFIRNSDIKLKEPCAILLVKEEVDVPALQNEINELILSEMGDHNQLGQIYIVSSISKRFDWKVAANIINSNGDRIVSNMEEDYAQILAQLEQDIQVDELSVEEIGPEKSEDAEFTESVDQLNEQSEDKK